jgi:hypothetical protein
LDTKSDRKVDANRPDKCDGNRDSSVSDDVSPVHKSSRIPPEERVPHLAFRGLRPVFDFGEKFRLDPDALVRDPLGVEVAC